MSYADMQLVHDRVSGSKRVVWLGEKEKEKNFILVLIPGGVERVQSAEDFSHLGFAMATRGAVDAVAERAKIAGILEWAPRQEPYPVGYYCGIRDPDGNFIEFSYGQPLGPGAAL
jgi:predicted lactoylglutathione lyase